MTTEVLYKLLIIAKTDYRGNNAVIIITLYKKLIDYCNYSNSASYTRYIVIPSSKHLAPVLIINQNVCRLKHFRVV